MRPRHPSRILPMQPSRPSGALRFIIGSSLLLTVLLALAALQLWGHWG